MTESIKPAHMKDDWLHDMIFKIENGSRKISIQSHHGKWICTLSVAKRKRLADALRFALSCPVSEYKAISGDGP